MGSKILFTKMVGIWVGDAKTWFEPDKLEDESPVNGKFEWVLNGRFLRHTYKGWMKGRPRQGEELIAYNTISQKFEVTWIDDFHMSFGILFSSGTALENGFSVKGSYDVGGNQPPWGWRTEYRLVDDNHLMMIAYNVMPEDGPETKAVEINYHRVPA